jgi:hypothetical protein
MRLALEEHKRGDVAVFVLEQDTPSQIFEF